MITRTKRESGIKSFPTDNFKLSFFTALTAVAKARMDTTGARNSGRKNIRHTYNMERNHGWHMSVFKLPRTVFSFVAHHPPINNIEVDYTII